MQDPCMRMSFVAWEDEVPGCSGETKIGGLQRGMIEIVVLVLVQEQPAVAVIDRVKMLPSLGDTCPMEKEKREKGKKNKGKRKRWLIEMQISQLKGGRSDRQYPYRRVKLGIRAAY